MPKSIARLLSLLIILTAAVGSSSASAADRYSDIGGDTRGDRLIADYFRRETRRLAKPTLADIETFEDWKSRKKEYRRQLFEMLGLDPRPEKTPLEPQITGTVEGDGFLVEKLHFQSRPGLYVTANFYLPEDRDEKLPSVLYVCGHGRVKQDGVSYGNKVHYQHHGAWFARNGYACLTIDTLQLGEIEGIHHGTYRHGKWWWNARGYTPAGVEAWNCIRALDYLETRPEVDAGRIGVTGRSGGGAYSWWIAALDERIKAAVPVAGITNLKNHVVDGCVEGHCDCMYMVNTYRWDYPQVAALVAPRPLLISNSDKDGIFPLDGVMDVYWYVRDLYGKYDALDKLGVQITEGPHDDTQELRVAAFHWMNRFLKGKDPLVETVATKFFEPEELKVFDELPEDEKNASISETFVPKAGPFEPSGDGKEWRKQRDGWMRALKKKCFRGWPDQPADLDVEEAFSVEKKGVRLAAWDFTSQQPYRLRLYVTHRAGLQPNDLELVVLNSLDEKGWTAFLATMRPAFGDRLGDDLPEADKKAFDEQRKMFENFKWGMAYVAPRGIGPTAWTEDERERTHIRRRFMLLGQTRDAMRVWDVRRAVQALRALDGFGERPLWMQGKRTMAGLVLYASLFEPNIERLDLWHVPESHRQGPIFLNVLRFLDMPQAVAMAAERCSVRIYEKEPSGWAYPQAVARNLEWDRKRIEIRGTPDEKPQTNE